ncbi:MAG: hypothetical protein ABFC63_02450 [Thermoguttaceae bacterium]
MSENPFCTRHIRPGAHPFLFPSGQDANTLVKRLRCNGWRGQIIGRHGTGKSALLGTLMPALERAKQRPLLVELHDGQRRLPVDLERAHRSRPFTLLAIDGYEQLARYERWRLSRRCRRHGWGLLATAHESVGLPELFHTEATAELAVEIVRRLTGDSCPFSPEELAEHLARRGGDLREMLFDLYDVFERRRSASERNVN